MGAEKIRLQKRRKRLFKKNPICPACGVEMVLPVKGGGKQLPNAATIDHIDSRLSPEKGLHIGEIRTRLLCNQCNHLRGRYEEKGLKGYSQEQFESVCFNVNLAVLLRGTEYLGG